MNILFLSDNFPPEVNAPATRTYEHCREWVQLGANVTVLTTQPNFPQGEIFDGYRNRWRQVEEMDGIRVVRLWSYMAHNSGFIRRSLDFFSFAVTSFFAGLFEKADVIVATSPQFFTTWSGRGLAKLKRTPWVFELRDLWPESIASVGALDEKGKVYRFLEMVELSLYQSSTMVIPNTPAFKKNLMARGISGDKIHVIPNGVILDQYILKEKNLELRKSLGIHEPYLVGYIGTHGMAHSLDFIVQTIAEFREELRDVHFLFVGDGAMKDTITFMAHDEQLTNVTFLDPIPKDQVIDYLSILDASLVPLKKSDTFKTVIPSKIFEAAAMGLPILLGVEGQAKAILDEYDAGIPFVPENGRSFVDAIHRLFDNEERYNSLSKNARTLAHAFNRQVLARDMLDQLKKLKN